MEDCRRALIWRLSSRAVLRLRCECCGSAPPEPNPAARLQDRILPTFRSECRRLIDRQPCGRSTDGGTILVSRVCWLSRRGPAIASCHPGRPEAHRRPYAGSASTTGRHSPASLQQLPKQAPQTGQRALAPQLRSSIRPVHWRQENKARKPVTRVCAVRRTQRIRASNFVLGLPHRRGETGTDELMVVRQNEALRTAALGDHPQAATSSSVHVPSRSLVPSWPPNM